MITVDVWNATKCKHESVKGELWGAAVYEGAAGLRNGGKLLDVEVNFSTKAEALEWVQRRAEFFKAVAA